MTQSHFIAEGEVSFKALLFIPNTQASEQFNSYGKATENINLYVRRVFITDDFKDMMPNYLSFVKGVVDSDDLPLNVSREALQQHKLLIAIKKKLIHKTLDMIEKIPDDKYMEFWKEFSTNVKIGVIEDAANRTRLAKLLRFTSSSGNLTSLAEYVERMKDKQEDIYYIAGGSKKEVSSSPLVERLLKKGYEVLFFTEYMEEYTISSLPEFEGKKFQRLTLRSNDDTKEQTEVTSAEDEVGPSMSQARQYKEIKSTWVGYCGHEGCDFVARSTGTEMSIEKVINCQYCEHFNVKSIQNKDRNENIQLFNHETRSTLPGAPPFFMLVLK